MPVALGGSIGTEDTPSLIQIWQAYNNALNLNICPFKL